MAERKMRLFGMVLRRDWCNGSWKTSGEGAATIWFQEFKEWTKLDMAAASQLTTDGERWREIIKVTAAQIAAREREGGDIYRERARERESGIYIYI